MHGNTASWEYGREPKISVLPYYDLRGTTGGEGDARWSLECAGSSVTGNLI